MSTTVEHTDTASSTLARIPIGRRISELLAEKGEAYSIRAFAERIGLNRELFRQMVLGARRIAPSELELIAAGLGVSIERLKQIDTYPKEQELQAVLKANTRSKSMMIFADKIATELVHIARGTTERGFAFNNLGRVQYLQRQYDDAHKTWSSALACAKELEGQYGDKRLLQVISANLILTYTIRKEYSNIEQILSYVETAFPEDPETLGTTYCTRMRVQNDIGNLELAKKYSYRSLEHFEQTKNNRQIGHGMINVAYCEYRLGDFALSEQFLTAAIKLIEQHEDILVTAIKNYVKTLIKLGQFQKAISIVDEYESISRDYPDDWGKLQIMYTVLKDDPVYADRIVNDGNMGINVRYVACKCLFEFFLNRDDAETSMKYYKKGRTFSSFETEFFDEEGF